MNQITLSHIDGPILINFPSNAKEITFGQFIDLSGHNSPLEKLSIISGHPVEYLYGLTDLHLGLPELDDYYKSLEYQMTMTLYTLPARVKFYYAGKNWKINLVNNMEIIPVSNFLEVQNMITANRNAYIDLYGEEYFENYFWPHLDVISAVVDRFIYSKHHKKVKQNQLFFNDACRALSAYDAIAIGKHFFNVYPDLNKACIPGFWDQVKHNIRLYKNKMPGRLARA
ncbi:hypothetical protein PQ469_05945 [Mucilaginibacter sp. KACC 22773]|uniref:hypothetical protein n=1 Tax=Mucilaginibacter sp. KACC 22773 TaxID=3025671 RepID=UPI002365688B|nr:hypothetical protein [Mucilaginibacter sp. KACC 22773]WDF79544.1 hypothetical protein PQ469_05945 [Mucilaginibacter sp. KACC 22773]